MAGRSQASALSRLFRAYDAALQEVDKVRPVRASLLPLGKDNVVLRCRPCLRYLVVRHLDRRLELLRRYYAGRAALEGAEKYADDRARLEDFARSLPPTPSRKQIVLWAILPVLGLAQLLAFGFSVLHHVPGFVSFFPDARKQVAALSSSIFSLEPGGVYETMQSLGSSSATTAFAAVLLLGVAVDVLLVLAVPAFLVKRSVFNRCLGNEPASSRRKALHENATATLGAYEVEAAFFRDIGVRPPWELPLDLLALGLILAVVLGLAATDFHARGLNVTIAVAGTVGVSFVRFWRERRGIWRPRGVTPETPALLHSGA